jgi:hypothetical protein
MENNNNKQSTIKQAVVITSIFAPTEAVFAFAKQADYKLIVVGDKKTPADWACENVAYLSVADQMDLGYEMHQHLPYNHYCRKMLGYLYARQQGAKVIVDTDDDNIPYADWQFPDLTAQYDTTAADAGFINIYQAYTEQPIWPRGLPLRLIKSANTWLKDLSPAAANIGVWQGLADEDPDVDAIYRLTSDAPCFFGKRAPIALAKGTVTPFNSQNTMFRSELFSLMYLPGYVTFRFTDILRGIVAQPIMWKHGYQLGFTNATVIQKRNPHDYFKDFVSEIPMYEHIDKLVEIVDKPLSANFSVAENLYVAYEALLAHNIVTPAELKTLAAWVDDCSKL